MICGRKTGILGSGVPWNVCKGELTKEQWHDSTGSVLFGRTTCLECGHVHEGILWQR